MSYNLHALSRFILSLNAPDPNYQTNWNNYSCALLTNALPCLANYYSLFILDQIHIFLKPYLEFFYLVWFRYFSSILEHFIQITGPVGNSAFTTLFLSCWRGDFAYFSFSLISGLGTKQTLNEYLGTLIFRSGFSCKRTHILISQMSRWSSGKY